MLSGLLIALAIVGALLVWRLWSVPVGPEGPLFAMQARLPAPLGLVLIAAMAVGGGIGVASIFAVRAFRRGGAALATSTVTGTGLGTGDGEEAGSPRQRRRWTVAAVIIVAVALLLAEAVRTGSLQPVEAALILISGALTVVAALFAVESLASGEGLRFDSHWGGLGGGMGGWRLSPASTLVLLTLIFLAATFSAARILAGGGHGDSGTENVAGNSADGEEGEALPTDSNAADANAAEGNSADGNAAAGGATPPTTNSAGAGAE